MLRSLNSGVTGLQQFQQQMDVIGNNIANVNTTGYKGARANFADTFSQTLQGGAGGGALQVGSGVTTNAVSHLFQQGALTRTNAPTDLAISGEGFFVAKDAAGSFYATRDGAFHLDKDNYLVSAGGLKVQGLSNGAPGDLKIDEEGAPGAAAGAKVVSFTIDAEGKVNVRLSDGTAFQRGQVLLQKFANPQALVKEGNNLYAWSAAAGPQFAANALQAPDSSGLGRLEAGALEMSNVDLTTEFSRLITTQRAFQASARILTTSDEILQELVNLKR